jgi:hypothetical protein
MKEEEFMNRIRFVTAVLAVAGFLFASPSFAAQPDKYQVTGTVDEVSDSMIVVMKGKERFEIARDAGTKVEGTLAKGSKVTVKYKMTATSVEVKGEKASSTKKKGS